MIDDITLDMKQNVEKTTEALKKQLASIRTGRAHTSLIDSVKIDYYGSPTPIAQVANITTPDARSLAIKPWEKGLQKQIEKAILEANLGLTAITDGDMVRVPVPALTEERRKEFCKQAKNRGEEAKLAIRNARRDANDMLKSAVKGSDITEDEEKRGLKMVQDITDAAVTAVDELCSKKEAEIMTV
ncbi:MAG: ribosome recycling factor [Myxococcales bacterium]|nr:ribosome recycling factor [Myxococcales bacterium]USN50652.1 MAG: ribosome recycling factor [Myxococcales bacterium]